MDFGNKEIFGGFYTGDRDLFDTNGAIIDMGGKSDIEIQKLIEDNYFNKKYTGPVIQKDIGTKLEEATQPGAATFEERKKLKDQQKQQSSTKRVTAPELEKILYEAIPLLDHGFIRVVDYMGDDTSIVQAARVSYGKGTKKVSTDAGLIKYLMRHWHSTPFEMCEIKYHVKLPIFIARQWIRHRTANVNEYSARYSILDKEFYLPAQEHLAAQSKSNRQGRGDVLQGEQAKKVLNLLKNDAEQTYNNYELMLNERYDGSVMKRC